LRATIARDELVIARPVPGAETQAACGSTAAMPLARVRLSHLGLPNPQRLLEARPEAACDRARHAACDLLHGPTIEDLGAERGAAIGIGTLHDAGRWTSAPRPPRNP
jgi:hypothetical protein